MSFFNMMEQILALLMIYTRGPALHPLEILWVSREMSTLGQLVLMGLPKQEVNSSNTMVPE